MKSLLFFLNIEIEICEFIVKTAERKIEGLPDGRLRVSLKKGKPYFYRCTVDHKGEYISVNDASLCALIANREKYEELLRRAKAFLKHAYPLRDNYVKNNWRDYKSTLHPAKRALLDNDIVSDEEYVKDWLADDLPREIDEKHKILTKKGDYVRSKSEKDIADLLFEKGIPYKYEHPLFFDGNELNPDFTILDKCLREEVIWEHFGIVDDEAYAARTLYKIDEYARQGYALYERLIISCETKVFQFPFEFLKTYIENRFC